MITKIEKALENFGERVRANLLEWGFITDVDLEDLKERIDKLEKEIKKLKGANNMAKWTGVTSGETTFEPLARFTIEEGSKRAREDFWLNKYNSSEKDFVKDILMPLFAGKKRVERLEKRIERLEEEIMKLRN